MASKTVLRKQSATVLRVSSRSSTFLHSPLLPFLAPSVFKRDASGVSASRKKADAAKKSKKKREERKDFQRSPIPEKDKYALCDAMRYLRAFEVAQPPQSVKYELAVSLKTRKNGPAVRNRMRLPHVVGTSEKIAVICRPDSQIAIGAKEAGAIAVGEDDLLEEIKEGKIYYNRLLCHTDSVQKLSKANVGRILGPKGLMPTAKTGTIVKNIPATIKGMIGGTEYREKLGVIRLSIGQLGFTPEELQTNIKAFMGSMKKDIEDISDKIRKEIHEVVLSTTHGPGFSLNGNFKSPESLDTKELTIL